MPVIGFLSPNPLKITTSTSPFRHQGLKETGYVEGQNVAAEYRYADNQFDRLPSLAADLVRSRVAVNRRRGSAGGESSDHDYADCLSRRR
jgi:putative ABC transport system substrate-binding protein